MHDEQQTTIVAALGGGTDGAAQHTTVANDATIKYSTLRSILLNSQVMALCQVGRIIRIQVSKL